jgi:hypothetical protein
MVAHSPDGKAGPRNLRRVVAEDIHFSRSQALLGQVKPRDSVVAMATARLLEPPARLARHDPAGARASGIRGRLEPPTVLAMALLASCLYAAFAHGSVAPAPTERLQLALTVIAGAAAAAWLWNAKLVLRAPAQAWAGLALLIGFTIWSGLSLLWSVSPDSTWAEANRALGYALMVGLAVALGASHPRAIEVTVGGFLAVALAVTAYALGQKLAPGLHLTGLFNLDQTGQLPRLQEPFGYWNALGLFIALAVPLALSLAVDRKRSDRLRTAAASAIVPMLVTIAFTYSRGAALALIGGLAIGIALSGARLRSLLWLGLAIVSAAPPVVLGLLNHSLTAINVNLGDRELAGVELAAVIAACVTLLALAAPCVIQHEGATDVSRAQGRRIRRGAGGLAAGLVAILLIIVALSPRGLPGTVSHGWQSFTTTRAVAVNDPGRLLSADSENRWVWWKEAARAFGDRPIAGWGAGSFGVVHLLYRRDQLSVQQPHSVPLQFLAETGVIGAAARARRRRTATRRRHAVSTPSSAHGRSPAGRRPAGGSAHLCRARPLRLGLGDPWGHVAGTALPGRAGRRGTGRPCFRARDGCARSFEIAAGAVGGGGGGGQQRRLPLGVRSLGDNATARRRSRRQRPARRLIAIRIRSAPGPFRRPAGRPTRSGLRSRPIGGGHG